MGIRRKNKVWICLATVIPLANNEDLGEAKGACVNVLDLANSESEFREKVNVLLLKYGYEVEELEDVELFQFNLSYKDNLNELAHNVLKIESMQWGTFYTFDE